MLCLRVVGAGDEVELTQKLPPSLIVLSVASLMLQDGSFLQLLVCKFGRKLDCRKLLEAELPPRWHHLSTLVKDVTRHGAVQCSNATLGAFATSVQHCIGHIIKEHLACGHCAAALTLLSSCNQRLIRALVLNAP